MQPEIGSMWFLLPGVHPNLLEQINPAQEHLSWCIGNQFEAEILDLRLT